MKVVEKLSDQGSFIFEAIKLILVNKGFMNPNKLQWELLQLGIFIKLTLLKQAIAVMMEKGELVRPKTEDLPKEKADELNEKSKIIQDVFQKESEA